MVLDVASTFGLLLGKVIWLGREGDSALFPRVAQDPSLWLEESACLNRGSAVGLLVGKVIWLG